jgi:hypothetical protein
MSNRARRWLGAAIVSATFASVFCAEAAIPRSVREWLLGVLFLPHLLVAYALVEVVLFPIGQHLHDEWMLPPAVWAAAFALTLPASYLYVVAAGAARRLWRWARAPMIQPPESN